MRSLKISGLKSNEFVESYFVSVKVLGLGRSLGYEKTVCMRKDVRRACGLKRDLLFAVVQAPKAVDFQEYPHPHLLLIR